MAGCTVTGYRAAAADYLAVRRAMGYKLFFQGQTLMQFAAYLDGVGVEHLTIDLAVAWARQPVGVSRSWWAARLAIIRAFARYFAAIDPATEVPPAGLIRDPGHRAVPHIYTADDVARVIAAAGTLHSEHRIDTYRTLIALAAVTGMRQAELTRLDRRDVDLHQGLLTIRDSKFGKSRQIPIHPSTVAALAGYAARRDQRRYRRDGRANRHPVEASFFTSTTGTRLLSDNVRSVFPCLVRRAGITAADGRPARMHGLRHSFAVNTLIRWYRQGFDVEQRVPLLSTYLGHVSPASTFWYLTGVPELLALIADRLDAASEARP